MRISSFQAMEVVLMRTTAIAAGLLPALACGVLAAQSAGAPPQLTKGASSRPALAAAAATPAEATIASANGSPAFEVATVKPSDPAACCARTFSQNGRRFRTTNTNLKWLLQWAYSLQPKQIVGGPPWMDQDRFEIAGEIDGTDAPTNLQWRVAVQKLLTERFQIQLHHETREMSAYALVIAKGGPKLTKDDGDTKPESTGFGGAIGQTMYGYGSNVTIAQFFGELQRLASDKPIVDQTGLTGTYTIRLSFTREDPQSMGMTALADDAAPNLFDALPQQLGLKLEGTKAPVDVLVIDQAELPSDN
jgi:uncharacterized protein (TIGR03435 family)